VPSVVPHLGTVDAMRVGLSGGVGSGKSTVAAMLVEHGAVLIDADAIAREVVEPGTPGYEAVVARFGDAVVAGGRLDRPALAKLVFSDEQARLDLNAIVHPLVGERVGELMEQAPPDAIVVYDVPLLVESNAASGFDVVVIVMASPSVRLQRLAGRGMAREDAEARMAAQASDEQRREVADEIIVNDGTRAELAEQVDALWPRLVARNG
jgi:dephospho-CoA kinase